jgi:sterol desaturase/sphingolipid hydroxylase (fatty acid hydroxylase superfamily)
VNYGIALLVWDMVFGSYQPAGRETQADEIGFGW